MQADACGLFLNASKIRWWEMDKGMVDGQICEEVKY